MKIDSKSPGKTVVTLDKPATQLFFNGPIDVNTVNQDSLGRVYINASPTKIKYGRQDNR